MQGYDGTVEEGDIFLTSDPYSVNGAISHANDWLMLMPVYKDGRHHRLAAMFGHMTDVGGKVPGSLPTDARPSTRRASSSRPSRSSRRASCRRTCSRSCCTTAACRTGTVRLQRHRRRLRTAEQAAASRCPQRFGDDVFYSAMDACSSATSARCAS
jgi:N-methylhydantoinase B